MVTPMNRASNTPPDDVKNQSEIAKHNNSQKSQYRLQVKMSQEGREHLELLLSRTNNTTTADLVRDALRVYAIITEEIMEKNSELLIRNEDSDEIERLRLW